MILRQYRPAARIGRRSGGRKKRVPQRCGASPKSAPASPPSQSRPSAPGWRKAFEDPKRFGMSRENAGHLATIGAFFTGSESDQVTKNLPTGYKTLHLLALGFRSHPEQLTLAVRNGEVYDPCGAPVRASRSRSVRCRATNCICSIRSGICSGVTPICCQTGSLAGRPWRRFNWMASATARCA
jgi:hypothetical protein